MAGSFWDAEHDLAEVTTDSGEIQIKAVKKNKQIFIDVRKWFWSNKENCLKPGKGVTIPIEQFEEVAEVLAVINKGHDITQLSDLVR